MTKHGKYRISLITLWLLVAVSSWYGMNLAPWEENRLINHDVVSYYAWLPAAWIYQDVYFDFVQTLPPDFEGRIWVHPTPAGYHSPKMTMGLALLWTPFFALAHLAASAGLAQATGYSTPYAAGIFLAALFYLFFGLWFLRKLLLEFFSDTVTSLVMGLVLLATNLMYYVVSEPGMSHVYSFFLFSLFLWLVHCWWDKPAWKTSFFLGLTAGLIVLVRPANAVILAAALLWNIRSFRSLKERCLRLPSRWQHLLLAAGAALAVWIPQLLYWKVVAGEWLYYSYGEERFFWLKPHIVKGLLSWRKGWLIYTPLMWLVFPGLIILCRNHRGLFAPVADFLVLHLYVVFSWWCWWYGGSYGSRPMIETYALMAFPLGAVLTWVFRKKVWIKAVLVFLLVFLTWLNQFQMRQYRTSLLHWDSMSFPAYRTIFGTMRWPANYHELLDPPDYQAALRGEKEN